MLAATNPYFLTEAAKRHGAQPVAIFTFLGDVGLSYADYEIPQEDILKDESLSLDMEKGIDFSDINFPELSLQLINVNNKYTPGHPSFVFAAEPDYLIRGIRVELGYRRHGTSIIDKLDNPIYEGRIITWGPATLIEVDEGGGVSLPSVEIHSRSYLGEALEKSIAQPDVITGEPQPLVYGTVLRDAEQLADESPETPDKSAYFESGAIWPGPDAFDSIVETGGTMAISTVEPYRGNHCAKADVNGANQVAVGVIALSVDSDIAMFVWYMKLNGPAPPTVNNNLIFMQIFDQAGTERYRLRVKNSSYAVQLGFYESAFLGWVYKDCDFYLNALEETWTRISVVIDSVGPTKYIKVYVDGSEVLNWEKATALGNLKTLKIGLTTGLTAEAWSAYFDSVEIYDTVYRNMFQVAGGGAYTEISQIYVDGATVTYQPPAKKRSRRQYNRKHWLNRRYGKKGARPSEDIVTKYIVYGAVDFSIDVGGEVLFKLTKNATTHPVDIIEAIMGEAGESARVDPTTFAAAKAARPDDIIGVWIEDTSAKDAISEICSCCLYEVWEAQGFLKIRAYAATSGASIKTLSDQDLSMVELTDDTEEIRNKINVTYGWYERNSGLSVIALDQDSIDIFGERPEELQLEWGEMVGTESRIMAANLANLLLAKSRGVRRLLELSGYLHLGRIEPGDFITVAAADWTPSGDFEVYAVSIDLSAMQVTLSLVRFMGE